MKTLTKLLYPSFEEESTSKECFKDLSAYLDKLRSIKDYFLNIANNKGLEDNIKDRMWQEEVKKYAPTWKCNVNPSAMIEFLNNKDLYSHDR